MECFNELLHKLREVHDREVEGWQVKVQELSNKKGCDTKRMEELFTRNQQMKEQQRLLTENIKTLENRLRAGLCDRCTVTQEVAKRRQQEFEATQLQSLQHISLLAGEVNNLKKDNKRLRDEIRTFRAALDRGHSDHCSNSSATAEVKPNSSPDLSPSSGPMALVTMAPSGANHQPADGEVAVKTEADQRAEEGERRQLRGPSRSHFELYKPLAVPSWKVEHSVSPVCRAGERRVQCVEGPDQRSSIPPQALLKNSSSSASAEVKPSRHVIHTPVPCRPQPVKGSSVALPWPLPEAADWVSVAAAGAHPAMQTTHKLSLPRFPNLISISPQANPRRPGFSPPWPKQSAPQPPGKEPTVVFRLRSLSEYAESKAKPPEKKEAPPSKAERVSGEGLRDPYDGPLDLSDRGKSKPSQTPRDDSPLALQGGASVRKSPGMDVNTSQPISVSSPSPVVSSSSSCTTPVKQEQEPSGDHNHKQVVREQEQKEEVNGKTEPSSEKKVPVLTISLRPVVVLETLNSALQKQESLASNGKSSSAADEPGSSSDERDEEETGSGQERTRGCKRRRTPVEAEPDRDSGTTHQERKMKLTVRTEEKSPS